MLASFVATRQVRLYELLSVLYIGTDMVWLSSPKQAL